jgi:tetratricopeptide (TPR) repeat protein
LAYNKALSKSKSHPEKHNAYHNLGNSLMLEKNYDEAVEAYKNALRNNPDDEETRYKSSHLKNDFALSFCNQMLNSPERRVLKGRESLKILIVKPSSIK